MLLLCSTVGIVDLTGFDRFSTCTQVVRTQCTSVVTAGREEPPLFFRLCMSLCSSDGR